MPVKRGSNTMIVETQVEDPSFEQTINPKDSSVYLKLTYYTNPNRLLGNAKTYFDILHRHKFIKGGVLYFDTRSNMSTIRTKMNVRNLLHSFIMEDCFLHELCQAETIEKTTSLISQVRETYKSQLKKNIKTYAEDSLEITSDESPLELTLICSSYPSTYGEYARSSQNTKGTEEPKLQIRLGYNIEKMPVSSDTAKDLEFCMVRCDADMFLKYISLYGEAYYKRIQADKMDLKTMQETQNKKQKLESDKSDKKTSSKQEAQPGRESEKEQETEPEPETNSKTEPE